MRMIIMAAGSGRRMGEILRGRPKCMLEVGGRSLLDWQLDAARCAREAIDGVTLVTGCGAEHLEPFAARGCALVHNEAFATTNMVHSLFCAASHFGEAFVMSYGDIAYSPDVLERATRDASPISVVVDEHWRAYWQQRFDDVLADAESLTMDDRGRLHSIGQKVSDERDIEAQYIGLVAFRGEGVTALREAFALAQRGGASVKAVFPALATRPAQTMFMTDLLQGLINLGAAVTAVPIQGGWVEVDSPSDLALAERLVRAGRLRRAADVLPTA